MTKCTRSDFGFPACKSRKIALDFLGGNITSNGGILLLKQADAKLGLSRGGARRGCLIILLICSWIRRR